MRILEQAVGPHDRWISIAGKSPPGRLHSSTAALRYSMPDHRAYRLFEEVCNRALWFALHDTDVGLVPSDVIHAWEKGLRLVSSSIAETISQEWKRRPAPVMLFDYQLFGVARELRKRIPKANIAFFNHAPVLGVRAMTRLPVFIVTDILESLLSADLLGFQSHRDLAGFAEISAHFLGAVVRQDKVIHLGRPVDLRVFPSAIFPRALAPTRRESNDRGSQWPDDFVVTWIGRSDPARNPVGAIEAFRRFLEREPEMRGRARLWMKVYPSRQQFREYRECLLDAQQAAVDLNSKYATGSWVPVFLHLSRERNDAFEALRRADVLLVNSLADGMNLVLQEGLLLSARRPAVILSRSSGAFEYFGDFTIPIDPRSVDDAVRALRRAARMPKAERGRRFEEMRRRLWALQSSGFFETQLAALEAGRTTARHAADRVGVAT